MIDVSRFRLLPFKHQIIGIEKLLENSFFFLADEMGAGKTKQTIDAAQILYEKNVINKVLILAPNSVKSVWFDPTLGELSKNLWLDLFSTVQEFHARNRKWDWKPEGTFNRIPLEWCITNYEFIRSKNRLEQLLPFCSQKTLLICDESSSIKSHRAEQTKATLQIRKLCGRVVLLNGTPIANSPMDMFSQGQILDPKILSCKSYFHFRGRYAIMGGWQNKQIIQYQNLEDLQARFKPFVLRRLKKDCLDLPKSLPPITLTVTLSEATWKIYKEMRDDMVAWLSDSTVASASQAAVKSMRLAQITSGFLGGIEEMPDEDTDIDNPPIATIQEIGREKLDFLIAWHKDRLIEDLNLKLVVSCRFIPELARFLKVQQQEFPTQAVGCCAGKSLLGLGKKVEREQVLRFLDPRTTPPGQVTVGMTYGTGGLGHNFTASHTMVNMSSDYAPWRYEQAAARLDRPGQVVPVSYFDIVAEGPKGQKTIDHIIVKARRNKEEINSWTTAAWIRALTEE